MSKRHKTIAERKLIGDAFDIRTRLDKFMKVMLELKLKDLRAEMERADIQPRPY